MGCARGAHGKTAPRLTKRLTIPHRMVIRHLDGCPGGSGVSPLYGSAGIATADAPVHGESPSGRRIAANTARTTPRTIPSAILSAVDKSAKTGLTCFRNLRGINMPVNFQKTHFPLESGGRMVYTQSRETDSKTDRTACKAGRGCPHRMQRRIRWFT